MDFAEVKREVGSAGLSSFLRSAWFKIDGLVRSRRSVSGLPASSSRFQNPESQGFRLKGEMEKSEEQIMTKWKTREPPLVSAVCISYNHELYIREALHGFLIQETDFPFEIVLHDDASTDGTPQIIEEYARRYPTLIKPILQTVNQYSKGKKPFPLAVNYARGEYFALCEGDDYWTDPSKLQTQIEEMRRNPECDMSFHSAVATYADGSRPDEVIKRRHHGRRIFNTREVISGGGGLCPTAALVMKKRVFDQLPEWFYTKAPVGDVYLQIFGSLNGGLLYIDRPMSVKREHVPGSWGSRTKLGPNDNYSQHIDLHEECYHLLNENLNGRYSREINKRIAIHNFLLSKRFLKSGNFLGYQRCIEKSWEKFPFLSVRQTLLFLFRRAPRILRIFLYFKTSRGS